MVKNNDEENYEEKCQNEESKPSADVLNLFHRDAVGDDQALLKGGVKHISSQDSLCTNKRSRSNLA